MNALPDSVLSYFKETYVQNAVDTLLKKANHVDELTIDNGLKLNKALLLARQTQFEYVDFLYSLSKELFSSQYWNLNREYSTTEDVWDYGYLSLKLGTHDKRECHMDLCFDGTIDEPELYIDCTIFDDHKSIWPEFEGLNDRWKKTNKKGEEKLFKVKSDISWDDLKKPKRVVADLQKCVEEMTRLLKIEFNM